MKYSIFPFLFMALNLFLSPFAHCKELSYDGKLSAQITRDITLPFPINVEKVFVNIGDTVQKGEKLLEYSMEVQDIRHLQNEISQQGGKADLENEKASIQKEQATHANRRKMDAELNAKGLGSPAEMATNARLANLINSRLASVSQKEKNSREFYASRLKELSSYFGFDVKPGQKLPEQFFVTSTMPGTIISMSPQVRPMGRASGPLLTIARLNPIQAQMEVHESEVAKLKINQPVSITRPDSDEQYTGRISSISWLPTNPAVAVPSYYNVWVDIDNPHNVLKPGFKVIIHVPDDEEK